MIRPPICRHPPRERQSPDWRGSPLCDAATMSLRLPARANPRLVAVAPRPTCHREPITRKARMDEDPLLPFVFAFDLLSSHCHPWRAQRGRTSLRRCRRRLAGSFAFAFSVASRCHPEERSEEGPASPSRYCVEPLPPQKGEIPAKNPLRRVLTRVSSERHPDCLFCITSVCFRSSASVE